MSGGDILRGHTETIILAMLKDGASYGYEISKNILEKGGGILDIKDATIYTAFRRMEAEGLITTFWGDGVGGARRRYYEMTEEGRKFYERKKEEWIVVSNLLDNLIIGG